MCFREEKTGFVIAMKKCGMRDSREKGAGMRDQDPLPDPVASLEDQHCIYVSNIT